MDTKGKLIVISGFSGVGKGTIMKKLVSDYGNYALSVSVTTRLPREDEIEGESYFFHSQEEFDEMIKKDHFIEYARYVGKSYGTPKDFVEARLREGKNVLLEIEIQGALQIKKKYPEVRLIFITPPDARTLVNRLTDRGTEEKDIIISRLTRAVAEADGVDNYNDIVVNDELEQCVKQVHQIIQSDSMHSANQESIKKVQQIQRELKSILKGE